MKLPIHPDTNAGALMDAYPESAALLDQTFPALRSLRNPVLRHAVLAHATLAQLAGQSGKDAGQAVQRLRLALGHAEPAPAAPSAEALPAWVTGGKEELLIDADAMLQTGVHPVGAVKEAGARLQQGGYIRLTSAFRPVPLLDLMARAGYLTCCHEASPGCFTSYFGRPA